jgi:hypothetical protein
MKVPGRVQLFAWLFTLVPFMTFSQKTEPFWLIPDTTRYAKPAWAFNYDVRRSVVNQEFVNIVGVNTGIILGKKRNQLLVGYYWANLSSSDRFVDFSSKRAKLINIDNYTHTDVYYVDLMYSPNLIYSRWFVVSLPVEVGLGSKRDTKTNVLSNICISESADRFIPIQAGVYIEFKATRYVGLSILGGYRYETFQKGIPSNFNGVYYSWGANFYTSTLLTDARKYWSKRRKEKSAF